MLLSVFAPPARRPSAYWVCTLIEESDVLEAQAAEATAQELQLLLSELSIGLIHGRLKPKEKVQIMQAFKAGEINLLVATTVIEVGVDVPNASLMIIENPSASACPSCISCAGGWVVAARAVTAYCSTAHRCRQWRGATKNYARDQRWL